MSLHKQHVYNILLLPASFGSKQPEMNAVARHWTDFIVIMTMLKYWTEKEDVPRCILQ